MIVAFSFSARPGKGDELAGLLADEEGAATAARAIGASRNLLLRQGGRFVRVFEFDEGSRPVPMSEAAAKDPGLKAFLAKVGSLSEPGFDPEVPGSLEAFSQAVALELVLDVRP